MRAIREWKIEREDAADAAIFTAITAVLLSGLEFFFTASLIHYISVPILIVEAAAASVAGALISIVTVKATDDED